MHDILVFIIDFTPTYYLANEQTAQGELQEGYRCETWALDIFETKGVTLKIQVLNWYFEFQEITAEGAIFSAKWERQMVKEILIPLKIVARIQKRIQKLKNRRLLEKLA